MCLCRKKISTTRNSWKESFFSDTLCIHAYHEDIEIEYKYKVQ